MSPRPSLMEHRQSRGIAIIEFAICIPVLLLLMLATAEIGRILFQYDTLTKAVRDGARYAASKAAVGTTRLVNITTQLSTETRNLTVTGNTTGTGSPLLPGLTAGNVTVSNAGNGFISVTAAYTYQPMIASLPTFRAGGSINMRIPLNATVVMRAL